MNQIPNIEWEEVTWNVLSNIQTGRMSLAHAQEKLDTVFHHQLQKAREEVLKVLCPDGLTYKQIVALSELDQSELDEPSITNVSASSGTGAETSDTVTTLHDVPYTLTSSELDQDKK